ncbi:hypothetical protein AMECASPLE_035741 [Ameca splendens]|uniref:Uncharacterized protein n=1 Tax=Ameca splendens TaxID=208324 RepID=A0ABV0XKI6_9TELE
MDKKLLLFISKTGIDGLHSNSIHLMILARMRTVYRTRHVSRRYSASALPGRAKHSPFHNLVVSCTILKSDSLVPPYDTKKPTKTLAICRTGWREYFYEVKPRHKTRLD